MEERDEILRQLKAKLLEAAVQAERGNWIDGDEAFRELKQRIDERRR
jgi:hypothetical protein